MGKLESLIDDHREKQDNPTDPSRLQLMVPSIGKFHTPLPLQEAWLRYDAKYCVSKRRMLPPSFNEVRHTLNLAQVMAIADRLEMICFDGDQTLYSDGGNFTNMPLAATIIMILKHGIKVVLITAAGYGFDGAAYKVRVKGLLEAFLKDELPAEVMSRFFVMGGECHYLMRCTGTGELERVPDEEWQNPALNGPKPRHWPEEECKQVLDVAEASFRASIADLKLRARLIRKPRGVGVIPGGEASVKAMPTGHGSVKFKTEALDEVVLRCQQSLRESRDPPIALPWCVFNGGRDAWVDVGNKCIGVEAMQAFLGVLPQRSLHVGDQFLRTGNDVAAREKSPCIWIINPNETLKVLEIFIGLKGLAKDGPAPVPGLAAPSSPPRSGVAEPPREGSMNPLGMSTEGGSGAKQFNCYTGLSE